jgi:hypothetical protein
VKVTSDAVVGHTRILKSDPLYRKLCKLTRYWLKSSLAMPEFSFES